MKIFLFFNVIFKMKVFFLIFISSVGVFLVSLRIREFVVTLNYSGVRFLLDFILIESNVFKKRKLLICIFFIRLII